MGFTRTRSRAMPSHGLACGALLLGVLALLPLEAAASKAGDEARGRAERSYLEVQEAARVLGRKRSASSIRDPERWLAEAELHLRTGQTDAAIDKLNLIVELGTQGKATEATAADARMLLGEAYFTDDQLYSARRLFLYITDHSAEPAFAGMGGKAASRLVDIALRTKRSEELSDVLGRVDVMLARNSTGELKYARAKALFALGRYDDAERQSEVLTGETLLAQQAAYLRGTALMKQAQAAIASPVTAPADAEEDAGESSVPAAPEAQTPPELQAPVDPNFDRAIAEFERAAYLVVNDEPEKAALIRDLSWLAVARLHYEVGRYLSAATAYQKLTRQSPYFTEALFELSWTYLRMRDFDRAQRALEVLVVLQPGLLDGAEASLLRADLMLRAGRFDDAEEAYEEARAAYEPLREQVEGFLAEHSDPGLYYDKLTASDVELGHELPRLVVDWAREEATEERLFAIVDEVSHCRQLVFRSRRIITLLRASLGTSARAKVFPEVLEHLESVLGLMNQLSVARLVVARGLDAEASSASGTLAQIRAERRALMERLGKVPTSPGDFSLRTAHSDRRWNSVSQSLQRLELQADHLQALVNGLRRVLREGEEFGVVATEATKQRYRAELQQWESVLLGYRGQIVKLREQVDIGRAQSGFGDERFDKDVEVRERFRELLTEELALVSQGKDSRAARRYAQEVAPLMSRIAVLESKLEAEHAALDAETRERSTEMLQTIAQESRAIEAYAGQLDELDDSARLLVGRAARDNFEKVHERLRQVVMRADTGLVQKAWQVREQQMLRVRELLRERNREMRVIDEELREVLEDAEGQ